MSNQIAQTIVDQMKHLDINLMWCMGFQKPMVLPNGLRFKVSGLTHKGVVEITLNGKDLYDIRLLKINGKIVDEINDVYAEDMMQILEDKVENRKEANGKAND